MSTNPPPLPDGIRDLPDDIDTREQLLLTDEERKALLGKLAEFELALLNLAPKQQAFVLAYLSDPTNGSAAARRAGYADGSAHVRASQLLNSPKVVAVIAAGQQLREDRTFITSDRILHELAVIAFSNIGDFHVSSGGKVAVRDGVPEYAMRAISSAEFTVTEVEEDGRQTITYKTKIRLWSKPEALRMLAMYQKLLSGEGGANLIINDNRGQVHSHHYQQNTWQWGDRSVKF